MADLTQNPEFQKFMQQYSGVQKAQPTTPQFVPQVPQATEGPLMANAPQPAFDTLAAQPLDIAAATPPPVQVASAPMEGASQFNVPDPVLPEVPQAQPTAQDGRITSAPELADFMAGLNEQAGLPRTQAPSPMPQTPQVMANGTPTSASGIGTSVVNDVNFLQEGLRQAQGMTPQVPTGGLTTQSGIPLSQFLSGEAIPEAGLVAESPMFAEDSVSRGLTGEAGREAFEQASADREAGTFSPPGAGRAVSDRERRAARGEGLSMADAVDLAGGDRAKARAMVVASKQPQAEQEEGLTFDQQMKVRAQNLAEGKFEYQLSKDASEQYEAGLEATKKAETAEARADTAGKTMVSAIGNMGDAMKRMGGRSGEFFGSGFFGKAASFIPGTSAYDQVADAEFLQSNVALNTMAELKELSPTGSTGFGALSEKELKVLTDKYANLNPFTSPDLFQKNLKQLDDEFNNMIDNAWNVHSKEYGEEAANAIYGARGGSPQQQGKVSVNYEGSGYSIKQ